MAGCRSPDLEVWDGGQPLAGDHAERAALADDLAGLAPDRWTTPSLCAGWSVHEVLGHMTATATMTPLGFFGRMARTGFRFETMTRRTSTPRRPPARPRRLPRFREAQNRSSSPPGPVESWLGETLVHGPASMMISA